MEQVKLNKLMDDIDTNDASAIKLAVADAMKASVLDAIDQKRKALNTASDTTEE